MVVRFGVSLDEKLVKEFDKQLTAMGYFNRSKAISDAVQIFLREKKMKDKKSIYGTISYLYDHHVPGVTKRITSLQHDFGEGICSTMHIHVSHHECIEVSVIKGSASKVKRLVDSISSLRGVKCAEYTALI